MAKTSISDVAERAGVSKATVSRVLSGNYEYMREATRQRVEKAIEELDYRPSSVARSLTSKRTYTAALMVSDVGNPFYADVIHGAEEMALSEQYSIYLCNTNYDMQRGLSLVQSFIDKQVDGVLIMSSTMSDSWLDELNSHNVPTVVLDWNVTKTSDNISTIDVQFNRGIRQAVDHLVSLGHHYFAHISGPLDLITSQARANDFQSALQSHGLDANSIVTVEGDLRMSGGRRALHELLALPERPTAVFTANDLTAIGLMAEARLQGVRVPQDLSVIGLDDIWLAEQADPPLTTVALPRYEIGERAMQLLFDLLNGNESNRISVETSLVMRDSTAQTPYR